MTPQPLISKMARDHFLVVFSKILLTRIYLTVLKCNITVTHSTAQVFPHWTPHSHWRDWVYSAEQQWTITEQPAALWWNNSWKSAEVSSGPEPLPLPQGSTPQNKDDKLLSETVWLSSGQEHAVKSSHSVRVLSTVKYRIKQWGAQIWTETKFHIQIGSTSNKFT